MKKAILITLFVFLVTVLGYAVVYFGVSYALWRFPDPLFFLHNIPKLDAEDRVMALALIIFYFLFLIGILSDKYDKHLSK